MTETSSAAAAPAALAPPAAAAVTAILAAQLPQRPPAPAGAGAPAGSDADSDTDAAALELPRSALATGVAARSASPSAASDPIRIDGGSQSAGAREPAATLNDLNNLTGALPAAATPDPAAQAGATAAPQTPSSVMVPVHAEVGSSGWANELGARLHWMVSAGVGSASLRLTPEQLGPVEVRISVHQNAASVWFSAAQPDTRSALEQSLPRLRELFSAQGMNLAQAGVSDQSARSAPQEPQRPGVSPRPALARGPSATSVTSPPRAHQGLIDTYA